jgi:hypothetical protein
MSDVYEKLVYTEHVFKRIAVAGLWIVGMELA